MLRVALIIGVLLAVAGCRSPGEAVQPDAPSEPSVGRGVHSSSHTVQLLVRDSNLRPVGVDCAGSGPFLAFHRTASFRVLDDAGTEVGSGTLPTGTSVAAMKEDLGVERVPTFCRFAWEVELRERAAEYQLAVEGREPVRLVSKDGRLLVAVVP